MNKKHKQEKQKEPKEPHPTPTLVFKDDLDRLTEHGCCACGKHAHEHGDAHKHQGFLVLSPQCHPGAPVNVSYSGGELAIECYDCGRPLARIQVGNKPPELVEKEEEIVVKE